METKSISTSKLWTGRIMSGLVVLFLLMDGVMKFVKPAEVINTTVNELGYQEHHITTLGIIAILCTVLYVIPVTSILGAVLLTAYFGGAVATHVRVDNPLVSHILFTVYLGIFMWGGIWLRDERLQALFPFKR